MKNSFICILLLVIGAICFVIIKTESPSKIDSFNSNIISENSLVSFLKKNQINSVTTWDLTDEDNLEGSGRIAYCITKSKNRNASDGTPRVEVLIIDDNGSPIYVDEFDSIEKIYTSRITRRNPSQLVINGSIGRIGVVKILSYLNEKIIILMDSSKFSDKSAINLDIRPQFQTGIKTGSQPYQVLLTTGIGLPSSEEKFTDVFRYKDGTFMNVGKFSTTEMDNYIEKILK